MQRAVIGSVAQVGRVFQTLELDDDPADGNCRFNNFIDFRDAFGGVLNLQVLSLDLILRDSFCCEQD